MFAETLTASRDNPTFCSHLEVKGLKFRSEERGSPGNIGTMLQAPCRANKPRDWVKSPLRSGIPGPVQWHQRRH
ncbi:hypothetical protein VTN02DRAFT_5171 [Thermoascus thermophilus]